MPRTIGYFSLMGEFDPDDITRQLGIEPDWMSRIGDPGPPDAKHPSRAAEWCLACAEDDYGDVSDQIISIVCKLRPKAEVVAVLAEKFDATLNVFAYLDGSYRGWFLGVPILRDLASLNIDVECKNVYYRAEEAERAN